MDHLLSDTEHKYQCTHFMFTNGDNFYVPDLWRLLAENLPKHELVAWNFLSHYRNEVKKVRLQRYQIDLGAFVVLGKVIERTEARFLKQGKSISEMNETELHSADASFILALRKGLRKRQIYLSRQTLFVHN